MIREPDGSFNPIHHWRADKPVRPYTLITGFGSPCGMTFYEETLSVRNTKQNHHCDAGPREVRCYSPQRLTASATRPTENLHHQQRRVLRPVDPCVAPDVQFTSPTGMTAASAARLQRPHPRRIYRISRKGKTHPQRKSRTIHE